MAFGTTQSTSVPLTGDTEYKALQKEKAEIIAEISSIGEQVEKGEARLKELADIDKRITDLSLDLVVVSEEKEIRLEEIKSLQETADSLRLLGGDIDERTTILEKIDAEIQSKKETLAKVTGDVVAKNTEFTSQSVTARATLIELDTTRQNREADVAILHSTIESLRGTNATLETVRSSKETQLTAVDVRLATLFKIEGQKKEQVIELDKIISEKKSEVGALDISLAEKRAKDSVWLTEEKKILQEKEEEFAIREGAISQRSSMLESRTSLLRAAKVRLEHHLGRTLDVIIE